MRSEGPAEGAAPTHRCIDLTRNQWLCRTRKSGDGQNGRRCAVAGSGEEDWKGSHAGRGSCCARLYSGGELRRPKPEFVRDTGNAARGRRGRDEESLDYRGGELYRHCL